MNYKQLLMGAGVIAVLVAGAYVMLAPKAEQALYEDAGAVASETELGTEFAPTESDLDEIESVLNEAAEKDEEESGDEVVAGQTTYTLADVAAHASESSCWTAVNGTVYDLTPFIDEHPGGARNIMRICGIDGTDAFEGKHGGEPRPENTLAGHEIGVLVQ